MMSGIQNIISSPTFYNFTQSTATQMSIKTGINAISRPGFILMDNNIDPHTKKFSAAKECLYQLTSLALFMALIVPIFKNGGYKLARKIFKDEGVFHIFEKPNDVKIFHKLPLEEKKAKLPEFNEKIAQLNEGRKIKLKKVKLESEQLANGVIETCSLVGSVVGLAIIAPITASKLIHPVMKKIEKMDDNKKVDIQG